MKKLIVLFFCAVFAVPLFSGWVTRMAAPPQPPTDEEKNLSYIAKERTFFKPVYPYREIDGVVSYAKGAEWVQFVGKVVEVHGEKGIRVQGWYGAPMSWNGESDSTLVVKSQNTDIPDAFIPMDMEFFVTNFPVRVPQDARIVWSQKFVAKSTGTYTYTTVLGGTRTLTQLDFGTIATDPSSAPLTAEQKEAIEKAKAARDLKDMEREKKLADEGNPYGQYKMGMRYLRGRNVEQNRQKALDLLGKASVQGSEEAKIELQRALAEAAK
jgi:hypothetical protein